MKPAWSGDGLVTVKPNRRMVVAELAVEWVIDDAAGRAQVKPEAAARAATHTDGNVDDAGVAEARGDAAPRSGDGAANLTRQADRSDDGGH